MNRDPHAWARLGRTLRTTRERRRLSQDELAASAGVSTASIQSLEAGTVPKSRMPITLAPVAQALGWAPGTVEAVLDGGTPPGEWHDVSVQQQMDEAEWEGILTSAMVRAIDGASTAEIRAATKNALDELRRRGVIAETTEAQPPTKLDHP